MGTLLSARTSMAVLAERYELCVGRVTVRCERCSASDSARCDVMRYGASWAMRSDVMRVSGRASARMVMLVALVAHGDAGHDGNS